jgi:hypothetical protein
MLLFVNYVVHICELYVICYYQGLTPSNLLLR